MKNINDFEVLLKNEYKKLEDQIKRPNILIVGGTGVGKSSLVNLCFGANIVESGCGRPITKKVKAFSPPNIPIVLFDTKGYEVHDKNFLKKILKRIRGNKKNPNNQIHLIWYCIAASGHRITDFDEANLSIFQETGIPVAVVFTKCDCVTDTELFQLHTVVSDTFPKFNITNQKELKFFELNLLCEWSTKNLGEGLQVAFIVSQRVNLDIKRREASKVIYRYSGSSFLRGGYSNTTAFKSHLALMISEILHIYQLYFLTSIAEIISKACHFQESQPITNPVNSLFKLVVKTIPLMDIIEKWFDTGTQAATLTLSTGLAISDICYKVHKLIVEGEITEAKNFFENMEALLRSTIDENCSKGKEALNSTVISSMSN